MSAVYLFNPDNDLALAKNIENYTPPPLAQLITRDLSTLPFWYAEPGTSVWLPTPDFAAPLSSCLHALKIGVRPLFPENFSVASAFIPWGWSRAAVHRFVRLGAPVSLLPDAAVLDAQRYWAHRIRTREVLSHLHAGGIDIPGEWPSLLRSENEVRVYVENHSRAMLKAPWSGSGKGLFPTQGVYEQTIARWTQGVLRRQGEVIGEPFWNKEIDMAMEFFSDGEKVVFAGYSLFETDGRGAYKGNLLLSDTAIEARLSTYIHPTYLHQVRVLLESFFTEQIALFYQGYFGVDMMVCRCSEGYLLYPCVEINLRMNMGMVARRFYDNYVVPGGEGVYRVEYFADPNQLAADHRCRLSENPLQIVRGKIVRGYMSLNPIFPETRYRASVEIHRP